MQQTTRLESKSWAASGNQLFSLDTLPPQKRIRKLSMYCNVSGTKDAADALSADLFPLCITGIRLGNFVNIPGLQLYLLNWALNGRKTTKGTAIPGSGTTFNVNFVLDIPFRDPRQSGSDDGSLPCELVQGKALEITFGTAAVYGVGNLVITAGTVHLVAELVDETNIPQLCRIGYVDPNSQTAQLDPGIYKELLLTEANTLSITTAEVTSIDLDADGKPVHNNALHEQLVSQWNASAAAADGSDSELSVNTAAFVPLIWHDRSGKSHITKQPMVTNKGKLQVTGSASNYRLVYWRAEPKSEAQVQQIAQAIGAPDGATTYEPAVAKASAGAEDRKAQAGGRIGKKQAAMSAFLPGKFRVSSANPMGRKAFGRR